MSKLLDIAKGTINGKYPREVLLEEIGKNEIKWQLQIEHNSRVMKQLIEIQQLYEQLLKRLNNQDGTGNGIVH